MRIPNTEHTGRAWLVHDIARDFRVEDVWAMPARGSRADFRRIVELSSGYDTRERSVAGLLFELRWKLGALFGWDKGEPATIRDRVPAELRDPDVPPFRSLPFRWLYVLDDEFAAEIANRTMHGILHYGWVPDGDGYRAHMAVLVKPNGRLGRLYMWLIKPFRYLIVYPAMERRIARRWARAAGAGAQ